MKGEKYTAMTAQALLTMLALFVFMSSSTAGFTEPPPGSIYREYFRIIDAGSNAWRVTDPNAPHSGARQFLPNPVQSLTIGDLQGAIRAEAILDVWGGHPGTTTKRFRFNGRPWIGIPELTSTPTPGECYTQEANYTVEVPLADLIQGNNTFEGTSGGQTCWDFGWGQWGWYSIMVRVYYNDSKPHPTGQISSQTTGGTFGDNPVIAVTPQSGTINRVDFLAHYESYDTDGDGVYRDWQRNYHRGRYDTEIKPRNHVGTANAAPWQVTWNTDWVPNQPARSVRLVAHIRDNNGIWFVTNAIDSLTFRRTNGTVKLYKPIDVSESFWVRNGATKSCTIPIPSTDTLASATAARLYLATWNGIDGQGSGHWKKVNSWTAPIVGEDHYYAYNEIVVPPSALVSGNNMFSFYSFSIHHGVEMMWPGPAIAVRYSRVTSVAEDKRPESFSLSQNYPNPFNPTTNIGYTLPEPARVSLEVFDILGRQVTILTQENHPSGYHTVEWNGQNSWGTTVNSGAYIYRMLATTISGKTYSSSKSMILLK